MPYIERHLPVFEKLSIPWRWSIAHGAASNTGSTKWCKPQAPRLSRDGTSEYLNSITGHPNVTIFNRQWWSGGKDEMCNTALTAFGNSGVLMQIDADEIWTTGQLERIVDLFSLPPIGRAYFKCNYFVGDNIVAIGGYGNRAGEWLRAWRFKPGMRFQSHEPPVLAGNIGAYIDAPETANMGLVFNHYSWVDEKTVFSKLRFYGYGSENLHRWKKLQANTQWPVKLKAFMPWVDDQTLAVKI